MTSDDFRDQRVESSNQLASCAVIMCERTLHQRASIRIIHVFETASTLSAKTGRRA
jgi:hypothetical protein